VVSQGRATEIGDTHAGTRCVPQDACWFWGVTCHRKRAKFPRLQASLGEGGGVGDMAHGGAQHADGQGGHARRGFPALQGAWGRAQRGPLAAASPAARTRPPLPACVPDGTTAAERFAGRSPRRCVPRSGPQSTDPQLLSLRRNGWWASSPRRGWPMPCARPCPCRRPPCHPPAGGVWGVEAMWDLVWRPSSCERARPRLC
jgi:hypothetical protein